MRNKAKESNLHIVEVEYVIESDGAQNRLHESLQIKWKKRQSQKSKRIEKKKKKKKSGKIDQYA